MKDWVLVPFLVCITIYSIHQAQKRGGIHQKISHKEQYILPLMVDPHPMILAIEGLVLQQPMEEEPRQTI